jgi:hypothetical protein
MENLTYEAYRSNPAAREQLDAEVERLRHEAVRKFIVDPIVAASKRFSGMLRAKQAQPMPKSA